MKKITKKIFSLLTMLYILSFTAYADDIVSSKLVTGSKKLGTDIIKALGILAPIVCGAVGIYFGIRLAMADEQDKKVWQNRLKVLFVGFITTLVIVGLLAVIASYYKG